VQVRVLRTLVLSLAVTISATAGFARPHKLRVSDPATSAELKAQGAKLLADYGSFQLFETTASPTLATLKQNQVESADETDFIELNAGHLDTRAPEVVALRKLALPFAGKKLHLVQFIGPIKPEWREALEATGVSVVHYVPQNAYLVRGDNTAVAKMQAWAQTVDYLQWEGDYANDYKLHPRARTVDAAGNNIPPKTDVYAIQLVDDAEANATTLALIDQLKLEPVRQEFRVLNYLNLVVRIAPENIAKISAQPEVVSIRPYTERKRRDERQGQIMAGNLTGNVPSGAGYLAWLTSKGFTQAQFDASGFVVDVSDSGIDNGTTNVGHFGLYKSGTPAFGSRVAYSRLEGTANSPSTLQGCDGHGNLNSHIIAGFNDMNTAPHLDSSGYHYGLGICPFVKVGSSVVFDTSSFTSPSYPNLASRAYRDGARVSNNSWGADTAGDYDSDAQAYDALVRDAQPSGSAVPLAGNQQMVFCFAAGNAGSGAGTVGSPGTAKNVIVVGAAENVHSHSIANGGNSATGSDGCSTADTEANSAADIASFSSRGPCADGRQKPDLVAPGTHITGGVGQSVLTTTGSGVAISCFDGSGVCGLPGGGTVGSPNNFFPLGQQFYSTSSGTSHSTPGVAGACALLRQYFINASLTPPSPAMTKAFLVNAARYMTGTSAGDNLPSPNQGMGAVNLGTAFDGVARVLRDQAGADKFTASGQTRTISGTVVDTGKPFRVTLAWTDAPGSTTGNAYNNNLDLTVTIGGNTYKGNVFSSGTSITGGTADAKNNLESVFIPAGVSGSFVVTVTAANLNSDGVPNEAPSIDQDYALVIYNGTETQTPGIVTGPQSVAVVLGDPASFNVVGFSATPIGYQWYFNAAGILDATNSSYSIGSAQLTNAGNYTVVLTNSFGSVTSAVAVLTVVEAPLILTNPVSLTVITGATAGFTVTAIGAAPLGYQWQFNGTNIGGATASSYSISGVLTNDAGSYTVVVSNYAGAITSAPAVLTVNEGVAASIVISQIYGGGGNSGATYRNDFVELFNPGNLPVSLSGWSVQYASASGTTWQVGNLNGSIPGGAYYLVQLTSGGATGALLPVANATNSINISGANGKLALVTNQVALTGANPVGGANIADFVGYGTAGAFEGSAAAAGGGNTTAMFRLNNGATDTDDNAADFTTGTPNPRTSANTNPPPAATTIDLAVLMSHSGGFAQGDVGRTYTILVTNVGTLTTTGTVSVVDVLPTGLTATAMTGTGWNITLGTLTATRADILNTNAAYPAITLTVNVASNALASVTNSVSVSTGGDTNTINNTANDITSITSTNTSGGGSYTGVLAGWDVSGQTSYGMSPLAATSNAPNVTVGSLTRGSGVGTNGTAASGGAWGGNSFNAPTAAAAVTSNNFVTCSILANAGYKVSFSAISRFDYRRSSTGPTNGVVQYQLTGGAFVDLSTNTYAPGNGGFVLSAIDVSTISALQNVGPGTNVVFRIVNYNTTSDTGTWYFYDVVDGTALDFAISGTVAPLAGPPASAPTLTLFSVISNQMQFTLTGTTTTNYVIEVSTNLSTGGWSPVHTGAAPILFSEPATNDQRYYRGKIAP